MFSLANKKALVTGAASGIGAAITEVFAGAGAHVFVADRDEAAGQAMAEKIGGTFLRLDVTKEADCEKSVEATGQLDILVNNAGIGHVGTVLQTTGADMDRLYAVNVRGMFNMCKVFLPQMVERKCGVIINMASVGGVVGVRDRAAYCTTKFAVVGLTKSMAIDHALDGVRVNCICPGRVETPFVQARLKEYPDPEKAYREMSATQAVGRMGKPGEIAAAALYLASDEAAFATGAEFLIDGGYTAFLSLMALRHQLPRGLSGGGTRAGLNAGIHRMIEAPDTFDAQGWLNTGVVGSQPSMAEAYLSRGSGYMCTVGLLQLGLPANDPFWTEPDRPWTQKKIWAGEKVSSDHAIGD